MKSHHLQNLWVFEGGDQLTDLCGHCILGVGGGEMGRLTSVFGSKNVDHILGRPHILGEGKDALRHSRLAKKRPHFLTSPSAINLLWRHNVCVLYTPPRGLSRGPL